MDAAIDTLIRLVVIGLIFLMPGMLANRTNGWSMLAYVAYAIWWSTH